MTPIRASDLKFVGPKPMSQYVRSFSQALEDMEKFRQKNLAKK
jgi:hypothetical protein